MKIRWTFIFEQKHLDIDVLDEANDDRIGAAVEAGIGIIYAGNQQDSEIYVNLSQCLVIFRSQVAEEAVAPTAEAIQVD